MTARSHERGHPVHWDGKQWVYTDTGQPADDSRPCIKCGEMPTQEGYDPLKFREYLERAQQFLRDHPEAADLPALQFDAHSELWEAEGGPSIDHETKLLDDYEEPGWEEGVHYVLVPHVRL